MQYLALNGFRHSLSRYFNSTVTCVDKFNWTKRNALDFAKNITVPTTLIGFSDGATAALQIAGVNPLIQMVYAHSPMYDSPPSRKGMLVRLFRTKGDTTPTFSDTLLCYKHYVSFNPSYQIDISLNDLAVGPHEPVRDVATFVMRWKNHQFRNCLPFLPVEILNHPDYV